ncbi:hypothetical protein [uncultured Roseobacter sp.]|uniref:hypothetical protein n=1 Tax=uncultured Roseobacter sp. TaxID=114847 RepID=UPI002636AC13|nr:hypothetical protein [uncultured Roseobacter sp.]
MGVPGIVKKATGISRFVAAVEDQPVAVGLDFHKKTYSVALFSKEDGLVESYTCPAGEAALAHQLEDVGLNIEHIFYDSGPTGIALSRILTDAGFNASVIAACRIPRGYAAAAKNDRLDAVKPATYYARVVATVVLVVAVAYFGGYLGEPLLTSDHCDIARVGCCCAYQTGRY